MDTWQPGLYWSDVAANKNDNTASTNWHLNNTVTHNAFDSDGNVVYRNETWALGIPVDISTNGTGNNGDVKDYTMPSDSTSASDSDSASSEDSSTPDSSAT